MKKDESGFLPPIDNKGPTEDPNLSMEDEEEEKKSDDDLQSNKEERPADKTGHTEEIKEDLIKNEESNPVL